MIMATVFDLPLLTACTDKPIEDIDAYEHQAYDAFAARRDCIVNINRCLKGHPPVADCTLRIPLTESLSDQLNAFWAHIPYSQLYWLRTIILALLAGRDDRWRDNQLVFGLVDNEIVHIYQLNNDDNDDFFPTSLPVELRDAWVETVGVCAFEQGAANPQVTPAPIGAVWIVTGRATLSQVSIQRASLEQGAESEEQTVPLFAQSEMWAWELRVRRFIWQDERLPFGPIGFCPLEDWNPGERPRRYQNAFRDALGGLWEWEGGRATERNPFGGHWNVQLPNGQIKRQWVAWIERCTGQEIITNPDSITHINVEPDGHIADRTFDWSD